MKAGQSDTVKDASGTLLLIPTATTVVPELQTEFGGIPTAMIPLEGKPAFLHILERLDRQPSRTLLAAHHGQDILRERVSREDRSIEIVDVGPTQSLAETVLSALTSAQHQGQLVINFADTLVPNLPSTGNVVCFQDRDDSFRWTTFQLDDSQTIVAIEEKDTVKASGLHKAFVGAFVFTDAVRFQQCLETSIASSSKTVDAFHLAVLDYFNSLPLRDRTFLEVDEWFDFGHIDTYYRTRQQAFLNKRSFNSVKVDSARGVIRKVSTETAKFCNEIQWYLDLPKEVAHLAPRVFDFDTTSQQPFVELEFYGYPPLAESFLHGAWDAGVWDQVFVSIESVLQSLRGHVHDEDPTAQSAALRAMYEMKTAERIAAITSNMVPVALTGETANVNGAHVLGLAGFVALLPQVLNKSRLLEARPLSIIHGDLCLSNILFDRRTSIVRLIDPRGSFGRAGIYGDHLYDLAKLRHSFHGNYDHLVHNMFTYGETNEGVFFQPWVTERQASLIQRFEHWLAQVAPYDIDRIALIESLLFITMVPLHSDRRAQGAFLAQGLTKFTQVARRLGLIRTLENSDQVEYSK